jgi:hypothetical protein
LPFDFAKTQAQKNNFNSSSGTKKDLSYIDNNNTNINKNNNESCLKLISRYYRIYGIRALYSGWQFKSMQYFFQSLYTIGTLDYLEKKIKIKG